MRNLSKLFKNEKGITHIILILFILIALGIGVYLVQTRTNINPFAQSVSSPISGPVVGGTDADQDGFSDTQEAFMGTNINSACPTSSTDNAWPVDTNNNKSVNGGDVSTLVPYISGGIQYNKRYDLNQDNRIDQRDVSVIQARFLETCEVIEKSAVIRINPKTVATLGQEVTMSVSLSAYTEPVNLVSAQINFPSDKLDVVKVDTGTDSGGFNNLIESFNGNGQISIIKGSTTSVNTGSQNTGIIFARITFRTKAFGVSDITLNTNTSQVLRASDGENVLNPLRDPIHNGSITVNPVTVASPSISPTVAPVPVAGCTSDAQCGAGKVCRRYQDYPGNCMDEFTACAQATVTACTKKTVFCATAPCPPIETCVEFPNGCVVPPGWTPPTVRETLPPEPTPTPAPVACAITRTEWVTTGLVQSNSTATLRVEATGNCTNKKVIFNAWEDDGLLGADSIFANPQEVILMSSGASINSNNYVGTTTWITEFQEDGPFGSNYPPEFLYEAALEGETNKVRSSNQLTVAREVGAPSPLEGDTNRDQLVNLRDVSWLLTHWDKTVDDDSLDIDGDDNFVNNFDMSKLKGILIQRGVLRRVN